MFDFTADHEFRLILAYHTQGEVIYWKYLDIEPPNGYDIGRALAAVSGYKLDEVPTESGFAGYKDWFILFLPPPYILPMSVVALVISWSYIFEVWAALCSAR